MQKHDFVEIAYTGKIKETGQVFDSAESIIIPLGKSFILPALDKALMAMEPGQKQHIELSPEQAFGNRDEKLIKLVPMSEFKKHDIDPYPGMTVDADNMIGRVLSVSGGRVAVDFNHPLAGKAVFYDIEIKRIVQSDEEKIKALVEFFMRSKIGDIKIEKSDSEIDITLPPVVSPIVKKRVADCIYELFSVSKVKFTEVFEKKA